MTGMAEGLAEYDKEVFVIADGKTQPSDINQPYQIKRFNNWKPIRRIQKALFIKKICKQRKIEAIYSDSWKSVEYLGSLKEKIFILAHGTEIPKKSAQKSIRNRIKRQRVKSTFKFATKIIGSSTYTKDLLQASLSIDGDKIIVIHPGVDVYKKEINQSDINKIESLMKNAHPLIVTLARIEERKGHLYILKAMKKLESKYPNLTYAIAGDGPFKRELEKIADELSLTKKVMFLSWVTEPEKSVLLERCDLFVMVPTKVGESIEGFGMSYIDAAFHGVASLGSNSGGIDNAIIDGKTGLLAKPEDIEDITSKLELLLDNKELRLKLGTNGKLLAESKFGWKNKAREYLSVI